MTVQAGPVVADQAGAGPGYLDIPPLKFPGPGPRRPRRGGLPGHRPDWDNPWLAAVVDADVAAAIGRCSRSWEMVINETTGEHKARVTDYCHERLFCGICAPSEAAERAATWETHFAAVADATGLDAGALGFVFTMPRALSETIAGLDAERKRETVNALFTGVHNVMRAFGPVAWVVVVHVASSKDPTKPHVHFHVLALPLDAAGRAIPGYLPDRNAFAERRRRVLGLWNYELRVLCKRLGLGDHTAMDIHLSYVKGNRLARALRYELRAGMQDSFRKTRDSEDRTRAAVTLALSFLYPGGKVLKRIRGGGAFGGRALTAFFAGLGLVRKETTADAGAWRSQGLALLVHVDALKRMCVFIVVSTGELVLLPFERVQVNAHGAGFVWVRAGPSPGGPEGGDT